MSIKKRGDTYHYDFVYEGKRYRGTTKESDKTKALEFESHLKSTIMKGKTEKGILRVAKKGCKNIGFEDGFEIDADKMIAFYCKNSPQGKATTNVIRSYFTTFSTFCKTRNIKNFNDIDRRSALDFVDYLKDQIPQVYTRTRIAIYVSAFGNQLLKFGFVESNPFATLPKEKHKATPYDAYSLEELQLIEQKASGVPYIIYCVAINTGLRKCDIISLKKSDVNLSENYIRVKTQKTGAVVMLPMLPKLRKLVEEYMGTEGEYLFPELKKMQSSAVSAMFTSFLEEIGISHKKGDRCVKGIHSFRHTFVYLAAKAGIPINLVQAIVGHATPTMTMHYSNHASLEDAKKSLSKMPSFLTLGDESPRHKLKDLIKSLSITQSKVDEMLNLLNQI